MPHLPDYLNPHITPAKRSAKTKKAISSYDTKLREQGWSKASPDTYKFWQQVGRTKPWHNSSQEIVPGLRKAVSRARRGSESDIYWLSRMTEARRRAGKLKKRNPKRYAQETHFGRSLF